MINALNEPDLYRFFCLSLYRNSYYNVRLRIEDIAKIIGEKKDTLKNFNKSMDTVLTRKKYPSPINHPVYEFTMRSLYKIPAMDYKGFIPLSPKFTQVKLSVKVKGYYIKLLLIAENNTIPLTNIGIANKLGISKNTGPQDNIELFQAGWECNLNSVWFLFLLNHNKYNFFFLDLQMLLKVVFGCVQGRRRMSRLYTLAHIRELPFLCV